MAVRPILKMGNPVLREQSRKIKDDEFGSEFLKDLIKDMSETMAKAGGIGIAAPQIGELVQVAIVGIEKENPRYDVEVEFDEEIIINPEIEYLTEDLSGNWEGCLSVPGLRGYVERPAEVKVKYRDINGVHKEIHSDDFVAIVLQHELDHLFGKLYVDRINDIRNLVYEDQLVDEEE
jgi:peptide deformylase